MNSYKHIPLTVFCIGLFLLAYAMFVFFSSSPLQLKRKTALKLDYAPKISRPPLDLSSPDPMDVTHRNFQAAMRFPAENFLKKARIEMNVPQATHFRTEKGVLVGETPEGSDDFYFFVSNKLDKPIPYLQKHFARKFKLQSKSEQQYFNKGGFLEMRLYKGVNSDGEEFQAYLFKHPKTKKQHILFLKDRNLSRQPARVRALVDSMRAI